MSFVKLPDELLRHRQALGLDLTDIVIVAVIRAHDWTGKEYAYPGQERIAERAGVSVRAVQRRTAKLERLGLLKRERRTSHAGNRGTYGYSWEGLTRRLTELEEGETPLTAVPEATGVSPRERLDLTPVSPPEATGVSPPDLTPVSCEVEEVEVDEVEKTLLRSEHQQEVGAQREETYLSLEEWLKQNPDQLKRAARLFPSIRAEIDEEAVPAA